MVAKPDTVRFACSTLTTIILYWYYLTGSISTYIIVPQELNDIEKFTIINYIVIIHETEKTNYVDMHIHETEKIVST